VGGRVADLRGVPPDAVGSHGGHVRPVLHSFSLLLVVNRTPPKKYSTSCARALESAASHVRVLGAGSGVASSARLILTEILRAPRTARHLRGQLGHDAWLKLFSVVTSRES
jgi:hypothetical protein